MRQWEILSLPARYTPATARGHWLWLPGDWTPEEWHTSWKWETFWPGFVAEMALRVLGEVPYYYQAEPNLRIQKPGEIIVPWHTDAELGHLPGEVNVWVPLVWLKSDSQRLWVEEEDDEALHWSRMAPPVQLGQALVFPGARLRHGNRPNRTNTTRYSFDFRLVRREDYVDTGRKSIEYGVPLRLGDYWREP